jgi:hypothetical protein
MAGGIPEIEGGRRVREEPIATCGLRPVGWKVECLVVVDRDARRQEGTRSGVVEQWLRRAAGASALREIEDATAAYYLSLRDDERAEGEALSKGLSKAARRVSYEKGARSRGRRVSR